MNIMKNSGLSPLQQKVLLAIVVLLLLSVYFLKDIYITIFISYFLAFLINPVVRKLEKRGFGRLGPIFFLLFLIFIVIAAFAFLMVPKVITQLRELFDKLPMLLAYLSERLSPYSIKYLGYDVFTQWSEMLPQLLPKFTAFPAAGILESVFTGTMKAISALLSVLLIPILTFYMLKDYYKLNDQLLQMVPRRYVKDVQEVMRRLSIVLGALIRGQFLVCSILAVLYTVALSGIGMEMALLLGIFSGFMNLVPFVGPLASFSLSLFIAVLSGLTITRCVGLVGVYLLMNLIDSTILTPKIVGKRIGINALAVILALLAGGELLGFLGVLLALPMMAMVRVLGGYLTERYYESPYYKEEGPIEGRQDLSEGI